MSKHPTELVLARRAIVVESTTQPIPKRLQGRVRLRRSLFLHSTEALMGQRFSAGDTGSVIGMARDGNAIVRIEKEDVVVAPKDLVSAKRRRKTK